MSGAEIVSVVEQVVSTGYRIYTVYCSLRDAPAEVRQFCDELQSLRGVLSDIGVSASKHHDVVSAGGRAIGPDSILISLKGCESELNTIWLDVSQLQSNRGLEWRQALQKLTKSVRWMLKTEEIEKATKRLERLKQSLVLSMVFCGLNTDTTVLESLASIGSRVDENSSAVEVHMQQLEDTLLLNLRQLEHRFLQRVEDLTGRATMQHVESDQRIADLSSILPATDAEERVYGLPRPWTVEDKEASPPISAFESGLLMTQDSGQAGTVSDGLRPPTDADVHHPGSRPPSRVPSPSPLPAESRDSTTGKEFGEALRALQSRLSRADMEALNAMTAEATKDPGLQPNLQETMAKMATLDLKNIETGRANRSTRIRDLARQIIPRLTNGSKMFDVLADEAPHSEDLMLVTIRQVLQVTEKSGALDAMERTLEAMMEMQDAFEMCEREYALYPEPKLKSLVVKLYAEVVSSLAKITQALMRATRGQMNAVVLKSMANRGFGDIDAPIERIRGISQKIMREVEYLQRRELREAHIRLREVDRKQDHVIRALEEQRKIMLSLQEEQNLLASVAGHQKVLQMLQQLLARTPATTAPRSDRVIVVGDSKSVK